LAAASLLICPSGTSQYLSAPSEEISIEIS
jgi:hypothetical protein